MAIIKFRCAPSHSYGDQRIEPVEVESETAASVYINGRRRPRISNYECFYDTWELAHAALMDAREDDVRRARRELERLNSALGNAKGMTPPATEATNPKD